jgi:hypothetical protein
MDQKARTKTQMRSEYDGWVRLWETIYNCPWPGRDRQGVELLAAYLDWREAQ